MNHMTRGIIARADILCNFQCPKPGDLTEFMT